MNMTREQKLDDLAALHLLEQAMGFTYQAALRSAAILGVADHLAVNPKTAEELGAELHVDGKMLFRIMRMLASRNIFENCGDGRFTLTPSAELLRTDVPYSLRSAVLMLTDETFWNPSGNLLENLKGGDAFKKQFGMSFYEYWGKENKDDMLYDFHSGMSSMSEVENSFLIRSYAFPEHSTVVDIAGGMGGLLLAVLQNNPTLQGILFDRGEVLARNRLSELNDESRWRIQSGDFFESCPPADIYLLKYIVMDWPDEQAAKILKCIRNAMHDNSKLLILEPVIPPGNAWHGGNEIDLLLLSSFDGGQTRTKEELSVLLENAGLKLNRIIDTGCYVSIAEVIAI